MSFPETVEKFADADLLDSDDRYALGMLIRDSVDGMWHYLTVKPRINYIGLLAACLLWIVPQNGELEQRPKLRLLFNLVVSTVAAGMAYTASAKLDEYQSDLEDDADVKSFRKAAQLDLEKAELDDKAYVAKVHARYQLNAQLPEAHRHPYLISAEAADTERNPPKSTTEKSKAAFLADMGIEDHPAAAAFLVDSAKPPAEKGRYSHKKIRGERKLCYDLRADSAYCGLPVVDVSEDVAADNYSLLLIGPSGSGKSVLVEHCIKATQQHNELVDFFGVTHKGRNIAKGETLHYAGLEKSKDFLEYSATDNDENRFISNGYELTRISDRVLESLHHGSIHPTVCMIDELNNGHKATARLKRIIKSRWDAEKSVLSRGEPKPARPDLLDLPDKYSEAVSFAFTQGQSKNFRLWVISHDNTNDALQMPHGEKLSARYLAIARDGQDAAFLRTFQDDRFIVDAETRDSLKTQYLKYKKAHKKMRSPANVVICVTNVGGQDWRLVILPQYGPVEPIEFNACNPHVDDIDGDGLSDAPELEYAPPTEQNIESVSEHIDIEREPMEEESQAPEIYQATVEALESALSASQPDDQKEKALALITWLNDDGAVYVRASGAIDPVVIANAYPCVDSVEKIEYLLSIAGELGMGHFFNEPLTEFTLWKFAEGSAVRPSQTVIPVVVETNAASEPALKTAVEINDDMPTVDHIFEYGKPKWMTDNLLEYVVGIISKDTDTIRYRSVSVLWNSTKFRKQLQRNSQSEVNEEQFLLMLKVLTHEHINVLYFDDGNDDSFKFIGFPPVE